MSQGPGTEKTRRLRPGDGRSPSEKDSALRALTGRTGAMYAEGTVGQDPRGKGQLGTVSEDLKKELL